MQVSRSDIDRSPRWATALPIVALAIYFTLMALDQPPKNVEGFDVDRFAMSGPERTAIALNSPAIVLAWDLGSLFDAPPWWVKWCLGAVPVLGVWHLIGWWMDARDITSRSKGRENWWDLTRLVATGLMAALLWAGSIILLLSPLPFDAEWALDIAAALLIWPAIVSVIFISRIRGR